MAEETKEPQQVQQTVEAGKRLPAIDQKKREVKKREEQVQLEKSEVNQYYGIGAVIAVGVIGGLCYYIIEARKAPQSEKS